MISLGSCSLRIIVFELTFGLFLSGEYLKMVGFSDFGVGGLFSSFFAALSRGPVGGAGSPLANAAGGIGGASIA